MNIKYDESYSITDSELKKPLSELKLENKIDEKFEEYCNDNIYSCLNSTVSNNTKFLFHHCYLILLLLLVLVLNLILLFLVLL